jgi:hypothetical protein
MFKAWVDDLQAVHNGFSSLDRLPGGTNDKVVHEYVEKDKAKQPKKQEQEILDVGVEDRRLANRLSTSKAKLGLAGNFCTARRTEHVLSLQSLLHHIVRPNREAACKRR